MYIVHKKEGKDSRRRYSVIGSYTEKVNLILGHCLGTKNRDLEDGKTGVDESIRNHNALPFKAGPEEELQTYCSQND